jgi:hypothetical protein
MVRGLASVRERDGAPSPAPPVFMTCRQLTMLPQFSALSTLSFQIITGWISVVFSTGWPEK